MKKLCFAAVLSIALIFGTSGQAEAASYDTGTPAGLYSVYQDGSHQRFINHVDGYGLLVDQNLTVDMSISGVCATLESTDKRIEIFRQQVGNGFSRSDYTTYSNGFLSNTTDHFLEYRGTQEFKGRNVHITQWSRNKLARVANDKNYYLVLDIPVRNNEVVTIFVSSSMPIYESGGYAHMLNSFEVLEKTAQPYLRKAKDTSASARGWNEETEIFFNHYFSQDAGLTWGIFEPRTPHDFNHLAEYEAKVEYKFPIILNYSSFENTHRHGDLEARLANTWAQGRTLELTLQPDWTAAGQSNMVYDILNGVYDEYLTNYAKTVADFGHPVLFRLGNEMNGDWCSYSSYNTSRDPMIFKEFYRYVYGFFERAGAQNVVWIWNPNGKSFPDFNWNHELMYYPGDRYVDVVGMTAYNTGTYYRNETWQSFAALYDNLYYGYIERYDKPLMITEFASASAGGDKNQWVIDMFNHIRYYPHIKVAVWWDGCDWDTNGNIARSYFIDDPEELIDTFRRCLQGTWTEKPADVRWKRDVLA